MWRKQGKYPWRGEIRVKYAFELLEKIINYWEIWDHNYGMEPHPKKGTNELNWERFTAIILPNTKWSMHNSRYHIIGQADRADIIITRYLLMHHNQISGST